MLNGATPSGLPLRDLAMNFVNLVRTTNIHSDGCQ